MIFNAGVTYYKGKYVMVFRNDYGEFDENIRFEGTNLGLAYSEDGINWEVEPEPFVTVEDAKKIDPDIERFYDPRLTVIEGKCYMCFAVDTANGIRGGIAVTEDFSGLEVISMSTPDNRNMVLFPEKMGGKFLRLERPFPVYGRNGREQFDAWISQSPDLKHWGNNQLLLRIEDVPYVKNKIGPGAPPVKTEEGWLTTFHGVNVDAHEGKNGWEDEWTKEYYAGLILLEKNDPYKIRGIYDNPLLAPEADYETEGGFRNNVIFPGGMILEESGEVKIYYGAADTVECLATADVNDLLELCLNGDR